MNKTNIDGYYFFDAARMPKSPVVLEVGAFSSDAVRVLSGLYPAGRFTLVEASPTCYGMLQEHIKGIPNTNALNFALAVADEDVAFHEFEEGPNAFSLFAREAEVKDKQLRPSKVVTVSGKRLSSLLDIAQIATADLVLLNCEGGELFALEQLLADESLRKRIGQLCLSFHCDHVKIYSPDIKEDLLRRLAPHYEIIRGDDKIVGYYLMVGK